MTFKKIMAVSALAIAAAAFSGPAFAAEVKKCDRENLVQSGTIIYKVSRVGFLIGVSWGDGTLTLNNGERHAFDVMGAKILETGIAEAKIEGEVYNLKQTADFEGTYYGSSTQMTLVKGKGEVITNNANCVFIRARAATGGIQLSAPAPEGLQFKFE